VGDIPDVTIGLPTHNGAPYLAEALEALLAQDYPSLEIIVSDNASSDATPAIIGSVTARDPRIRALRSDVLMTAAENFNLVFAKGRGRYFLWAADDDLWDPAYVRLCVDALEANPAAVMACAGLRFIDPSGAVREADYSRYDNPDLSSPSIVERTRRILRRGGWYQVYGVARRSALLQTHLFQDVYGPDVVLTMELAMLGPILKVPEPLFFYRQFPERTEAARVARQGGVGDGSAVIATRMTRLQESLSAAVAGSLLSGSSKLRLRAEILRAAYVDDTPLGRVARREIGTRIAAARRNHDRRSEAKYRLLLAVQAPRRIAQALRGLAASVRRVARSAKRRIR